jgi:hypothetical protein
MFLECAQAARAEYLVTDNLKHFPPTWRAPASPPRGTYSMSCLAKTANTASRPTLRNHPPADPWSPLPRVLDFLQTPCPAARVRSRKLNMNWDKGISKRALDHLVGIQAFFALFLQCKLLDLWNCSGRLPENASHEDSTPDLYLIKVAVMAPTTARTVKTR